ncbi:hypothetical protein B0H16DRAFT_1526560 [Mycena metata]|uniref:HNH nuclease domain-containing protein n=1 Tax=Mycena metata TaxID=1033252 RepID=A0AAD7JHY7_9AGAR|nr:hypothetical protein B0H16DRAFT_1526560 [Mycena metata]
MATLQLYLKVHDEWALFLEIPVLEALRLTHRPVKWLRYMGWCICGQPGQLQVSASDGSEADEDPGPGHFLQRYYYESSLPPHFMDVVALDDRTSNASDLTARRADFRSNVIDRDGTCIVSGDAALNCTPCHILPHIKGDSFIRNLMDIRGISGATRVVEMGDARNGVLLSNALHRPFGAGEVAFLLTPNLYLTPDDIPGNIPGPQPPRRLTIQHIFTPSGVVATALLAPHNNDARLDASPQAPSADILHFFYACAVLRQWGATSRGGLLASADSQAVYSDDDVSYQGSAHNTIRARAVGGGRVDGAPRSRTSF